MAVILNIKCKSREEMIELREKMHRGLAGSPGYIESEIAICDFQEDAFTLAVGRGNGHDIDLDVHSGDLLER